MKRILLGLIIVLTMAGCSGMQATKPMEVTIAANAKLATAQLASEQTLDAAQKGIAENAAIFEFYFDSATMNPLAYWFVKEKTIYCTTARYYQLLNKTSKISNIYALNTLAGGYTDDIVMKLYVEELKWRLQINDAIKGGGIQR